MGLFAESLSCRSACAAMNAAAFISSDDGGALMGVRLIAAQREAGKQHRPGRRAAQREVRLDEPAVLPILVSDRGRTGSAHVVLELLAAGLGGDAAGPVGELGDGRGIEPPLVLPIRVVAAVVECQGHRHRCPLALVRKRRIMT